MSNSVERFCFCSHRELDHAVGMCRYCHICPGFHDGTTEQTAALRELGRAPLEKAIAELRKTGSFQPCFWVQSPDGGMRAFPFTDVVADAMNDGEKKDVIFTLLRMITASVQATATVFLTDSWVGFSTDAGRKLTHEQYKKLSFQQAVDRGLATRNEAVAVCIQTPEYAMVRSQLYERFATERFVVLRQRMEFETSQAQFGGRQKMFGDLDPLVDEQRFDRVLEEALKKVMHTR